MVFVWKNAWLILNADAPLHRRKKKRGRQLWNFGRHMSANLPPVKRARRSSATVKNLCSLLANLPNRRDGVRHSLFAISRRARSSPSCSPIIFANTTSRPCVFRNGANNVGECSPCCPFCLLPFPNGSLRLECNECTRKKFRRTSPDSVSFCVHDASCPS